MTDEVERPLGGASEPPPNADTAEGPPDVGATAPQADAPPVVPSPDPARDVAADVSRLTLPGARSLIAAGFELLREARGDLTRASLYIGLLTLLTLGPTVALLIYFLTQDPELLLNAMGLGDGPPPTEPPAGLVATVLAFLCAIPGLLAISIDAELMAVGILAGHRIGRPVRMRESLRRSRQTFWRFLLSALITGAAGLAIILVLGEVFGPRITEQQDLDTLLSAVLGIAFGLPFAYATCGIVLGDAGPVQALGRSIRLARARPLLALVIALFTTVVGVINTFALGAGADTLVRIADVLHLDFQSGPLLTIISVILILAAVTAIGSLLFTISSVTLAPQVVAFLGLTHYSRGLELGRDRPPLEPAAPVEQPMPLGSPPLGEPAAAAPPVAHESAWARAAAAQAEKEERSEPRLITWPMFIFAGLAALCAVAGFLSLT